MHHALGVVRGMVDMTGICGQCDEVCLEVQTVVKR